MSSSSCCALTSLLVLIFESFLPSLPLPLSSVSSVTSVSLLLPGVWDLMNPRPSIKCCRGGLQCSHLFGPLNPFNRRLHPWCLQIAMMVWRYWELGVGRLTEKTRVKKFQDFARWWITSQTATLCDAGPIYNSHFFLEPERWFSWGTEKALLLSCMDPV